MLAVLTRGAGAVAIAGFLTFAPMAQQAAQADALTTTLKLVTGALGGVSAIAPGALAGATAAEAGSVAATTVACAATVICGGAMVAIGVGLLAYSTQDYWVPWVKSWAGGADPETGSGGVFGRGMDWEMVGVTNPAVRGVTTVDIRLTFDLATMYGLPFSTSGEIYGSANCFGRYGGTGSREVAFPKAMVPNSVGGVGGEWPNSSTADGTNFVQSFQPCYGDEYVTGFDIWSPNPSVKTVGDGHMRWGVMAAQGVNPATTTVTTNKVCQRPDGSTYTDSRSISNATDSIPVGFCLPGDVAVSLSTLVTPAGGSPQVVQTIPLTPTSADLAKYPLCAGAGCDYQILIDGNPCRVGVLGCSDWYAISQATPTRVTARYGPYEYDATKLRWLTHAYDNRTGTTVFTGTADGQPNPKDDPGREIGAKVPGVTDPLAVPPGQPLPKPPGNPNSTQDCFGATISWNPVDWVMKPIQCSFIWAFIPSGIFLSGWEGTIYNAWDTSPFGSWIHAVGAFTDFQIPSAGCRGPALPTGFLGQGGKAVLPAVIYPFDACTGVMAEVAATSNLILIAGISFYGGMAVIRQLGYAFGFQIHIGSERNTFT